MKVHVFKAKLLGYGDNYEGIWFDADCYSKESAESQFVECTGYTTKANGDSYPYTYYEYDGKKYYKVYYIGLFDKDNIYIQCQIR